LDSASRLLGEFLLMAAWRLSLKGSTKLSAISAQAGAVPFLKTQKISETSLLGQLL
jgi:hypothetical protein